MAAPRPTSAGWFTNAADGPDLASKHAELLGERSLGRVGCGRSRNSPGVVRVLFLLQGFGWLSSPAAGAGEALLCALSGQAELGSDDGPGCSGLAGSGDGGGQGGLGGVGLLVGGGDPAQDVERRTGW